MAQHFRHTAPSLECTELAAVTNFPSPIVQHEPPLSKEEKIERIAGHFKEIMEILGLDLTDPSLAKSPHRVAKMYVSEVFSGLDLNAFPKTTFVDHKFQSDAQSNIVKVKVGFTSFCEHHFVPFNGVAEIAYIPNTKLIGFSKLARIVRYFARRPQLQERLTAQVADSLSMLLGTQDISVSITATHFCVIARGVEDETGMATTEVKRGVFK